MPPPARPFAVDDPYQYAYYNFVGGLINAGLLAPREAAMLVLRETALPAIASPGAGARLALPLVPRP